MNSTVYIALATVLGAGFLIISIYFDWFGLLTKRSEPKRSSPRVRKEEGAIPSDAQARGNMLLTKHLNPKPPQGQ